MVLQSTTPQDWGRLAGRLYTRSIYRFLGEERSQIVDWPLSRTSCSRGAESKACCLLKSSSPSRSPGGARVHRYPWEAPPALGNWNCYITAGRIKARQLLNLGRRVTSCSPGNCRSAGILHTSAGVAWEISLGSGNTHGIAVLDIFFYLKAFCSALKELTTGLTLINWYQHAGCTGSRI